jgi:alkanesulfonate monooxygenase SsuD/methylene tetrahydromethanopterin reductase-like flavin-dependent oxidoreductase (luciferase family)
MKIGLGLPAALPNVDGSLILEWARQAEAGPFSCLGMIDRIVYANYETVTTLAAVAGVTQRLRLMTTILLAPLRSAALLAKQSASLDAFSGGRLTLGLAVGIREDDFAATGTPFRTRGKHFEEHLTTMTRLWSGQAFNEEVGPIGPQPIQQAGPEVLIGGHTPVALGRVGRWGNGYISGGGPAQRVGQSFRLVEAIWKEAGRPGRPRLVGCAYFGLGPHAAERARESILDYYGFLGPAAQWIASSVSTTAEATRTTIQTYADMGADELVLLPCIPDLDQVSRLAELIGSERP